MKKILLSACMLFGIAAGAQTINFPDANFKAKLLEADTSNYIARNSSGAFIKIDVNNDSEIDQAEALLVYTLYTHSANISSIEGIEYFTNVKTFGCSNNLFVSLEVPALPNLTEFSCSNNQLLTSLELSSLTNLKTLFCSENSSLVNLDLTYLTTLERLFCSLNALTDLNITGLSNLKFVECRANQFQAIDLTGLTGLTQLNLNENALTSIDFSPLSSIQKIEVFNNNLSAVDITMLTTLQNFTASYNNIASVNAEGLGGLEVLNLQHNQLTNIDLTGLTALKYLYLDHNLFTSIDVTAASSLEYLNLEANLLTSFNVDGMDNLGIITLDGNQFTDLIIHDLPNLGMITIDDNPITNLQLNGLPQFKYISCNNTMLVELDLSHCPGMTHLWCTGNSLLEHINVKNGGLLLYPYECNFSNNPLLNFICIDEGEQNFMQQHFGGNGPAYSTYCNFVPGGDFNTINGKLTFDLDNNSCDDNDLVQPFIRIGINDAFTQGATFTNTQGDYIFYTQEGSYVLTPEFENDAFIGVPATVNFPLVDNSVVTENFCITPNGVYADAEVMIAPLRPARPGFNAHYKIVYKNKGNQVLNGTINFDFEGSKMTLTSSEPSADTQMSGSFLYNYSNLQPFESREIIVKFIVNSPTDTPSVNIDDVLAFEAGITTNINDELPSDNVFELSQTVIGSYDPNNIICAEGEKVSEEHIGEYLHYVVNFENTGNYPASFIVVRQVINHNEFDLTSLQLLSASHDVNVKVNGNLLEFVFNDINLAATEYGDVVYKIKSLTNLQGGDSVVNEADIFFDYNYPVATNEAETTFEALMGNGEFATDNSVKVYPNPSKDIVKIDADSEIKSIHLYDIHGRQLQVNHSNETNVSFDLSNRVSGIYFIKVVTEKGMKVEKLIRE